MRDQAQAPDDRLSQIIDIGGWRLKLTAPEGVQAFAWTAVEVVVREISGSTEKTMTLEASVI